MQLTDLLARLGALYENLDRALPASTANPCGQCRECCTAAGVERHTVSELEIEYLAHHVGAARAEDFRRYAGRQEDCASGDVRFDTCPFYETAGARCSVYRFRPFSCRVFGHYRSADVQLPEPCVFRDTVRVYGAGASPLAAITLHLTELTRARQSLGLDVSTTYGDEFERARQHQINGEYDQALALLEEARARVGDTATVLHGLAVVLELKRDHAAARLLFERLADMDPQNAALYYQAGFNAAAEGDYPAAVAHLSRAVELDPGHAMALGFLGYIHLMAQRYDEAAVLLGRALEIDPDNGYFRLRLSMIWLSTGRFADAVAELQRATTCPETMVQAQTMLDSIRK